MQRPSVQSGRPGKMYRTYISRLPPPITESPLRTVPDHVATPVGPQTRAPSTFDRYGPISDSRSYQRRFTMKNGPSTKSPIPDVVPGGSASQPGPPRVHKPAINRTITMVLLADRLEPRLRVESREGSIPRHNSATDTGHSYFTAFPCKLTRPLC
jgi:hypothetical protein